MLKSADQVTKEATERYLRTLRAAGSEMAREHFVAEIAGSYGQWSICYARGYRDALLQADVVAANGHMVYVPESEYGANQIVKFAAKEHGLDARIAGFEPE